MCSSFEKVYLTVDEMFFDLSDLNEVYLLEVGKPPKLISKDDLEQRTMAFNDPEGRYKTSGPKRIRRGKRARLIQYDFENAPTQKYGNGYAILHFLVKAKNPTTKGMDPTNGHRGYIVYFKSNRRIKHMFCDCKDFFYRLYYPYVKAGLSTWDIDRRYRKYMEQAHNHKRAKHTNPNNKIFICKHLYRAINDVFDKDMFDHILDTDYKQTEEQKRLRQDITKHIGKRPTPKPKPTPKPEIIEPEEPKPMPVKKELPKKEPVAIEKPVPKKKELGAIEKEMTKKVPVKEPVSGSIGKKKELGAIEKEMTKKELPKKEPVVVAKKPVEVDRTPDVKKKIMDLKSRKSSFEREYDQKDRMLNKSTK